MPSQNLQTTVPIDGGLNIVVNQGIEAAPAGGAVWGSPGESTGLNMPIGSYVQEVHVRRPSKQGPLILFSVLLAIVVGWCVYCIFVLERFPDQVLFEYLFGGGQITAVEETVAEVGPPPTLAPAPKSEPAPVLQPKETLLLADQVFKNPYRRLTNRLAAAALPMKTSDKDEKMGKWREAFEHRFYYKHFKAVQEIITEREKGSEDLLRDALCAGKFWLRLYAVMGLASFGAEVTPADIETALGKSHGELRARFFQRFEKGSCDIGCMFVVRGSLEFLNDNGRLQALRVMQRETSAVTQEYMVAATFDQSEQVRKYARSWLLKNPVEEQIWWQVYKKIRDENKTNS